MICHESVVYNLRSISGKRSASRPEAENKLYTSLGPRTRGLLLKNSLITAMIVSSSEKFVVKSCETKQTSLVCKRWAQELRTKVSKWLQACAVQVVRGSTSWGNASGSVKSSQK